MNDFDKYLKDLGLELSNISHKKTYKKPLVSIIIPVYNSETTIAKCLFSIIKQTLQDIEIIVINDGSTDNSLPIIRLFEKYDSRIVVINNSNKGQGLSRNEGVKLAKGEYVAFVDSDDWIEEEMYEKMLACAKDKKVDIVQCSFNRIQESDNTIKKASFIKNLEKNNIKLAESNVYYYKDFKGNIISILHNYCWNRLYRTSFLKDNQIEAADFKIGEDKCFSIECKILANGIACIDEAYYNYRIRKDSSSTKTFNAIKILDTIKKSLIKCKQFDEMKPYFNNYAIKLCSKQYNKSAKEQKELLKQSFKNYFTKSEFDKFRQKVNID